MQYFYNDVIIINSIYTKRNMELKNAVYRHITPVSKDIQVLYAEYYLQKKNPVN